MKPIFAFGDLVLDVVARVEGGLDRDTDTPGEVRPAPGGSPANFAVWTARLGVPTRFACRVGDDMLGRALVADMRREGVEVFAAVDDELPTAVLVLFCQGTQRHMMVPRGANHRMGAADIPEEALAASGWLHVTGYSFFWEETVAGAERALEIARREGIPVSFDPSSAGFIRRKGLRIPGGIQVLMPNGDEALALTGARSVAEAAVRLGEQAPLVALKLGPEGVLLYHEGRLEAVPPAQPDGPVIDGTGAGDAWDAAFVTGLRRGLAPYEAAVAANRLGARIVTRMGARPRIPVD